MGEISVGDDELGFQVGMAKNRLRRKRRKGRTILKSGELLGAVTSSPPWAHAPGLPHEFRKQEKNS